MKIFVADSETCYVKSKNDYNWCINGEPLYLPYLAFRDKNNMTGLFSGKSTTNIIVKDIDISISTYKELFARLPLSSICREKQPNIPFNQYDKHYGRRFRNSYDEYVNNIFKQAAKFNIGDKIKIVNNEIKLL
jgi:hypothetical protein